MHTSMKAAGCHTVSENCPIRILFFALMLIVVLRFISVHPGTAQEPAINSDSADAQGKRKCSLVIEQIFIDKIRLVSDCRAGPPDVPL